jgi:hypothetical protein
MKIKHIEKVGIGLIILSLLISLNPFYLLLAIPLFIIGIVFLWRGSLSIKAKFIISVSPIILWYPFFTGGLLLRKTLSQKIEFVVEENFRGRVTIIYPVKCGQEVNKKNGVELINVPSNGIVYYNGNIDDGIVNWRYKTTYNTVLNEFDVYSKKPIREDSLGIFLGGGWSSTSYEPNEISYNVRTFWVDTWASRNYENENNLEDSIKKIYQTKIRNCNY